MMDFILTNTQKGNADLTVIWLLEYNTSPLKGVFLVDVAFSLIISRVQSQYRLTFCYALFIHSILHWHWKPGLLFHFIVYSTVFRSLSLVLCPPSCSAVRCLLPFGPSACVEVTLPASFFPSVRPFCPSLASLCLNGGVRHLSGDGEADARSFSVSHCQLGWSHTQISRYRNEHPTLMPLFASAPV